MKCTACHHTKCQCAPKCPANFAGYTHCTEIEGSIEPLPTMTRFPIEGDVWWNLETGAKYIFTCHGWEQIRCCVAVQESCGDQLILETEGSFNTLVQPATGKGRFLWEQNESCGRWVPEKGAKQVRFWDADCHLPAQDGKFVRLIEPRASGNQAHSAGEPARAGGSSISEVRHLYPDGYFEWAASVDIMVGSARPFLLMDACHNVIAVSNFRSNSAKFYNGIYSSQDTQIEQFSLPVGNSADIYVASCHANGKWQWGSRISGNNGFGVTHLPFTTLDSNGNIVISGTYKCDSVSFYNSDQTMQFGLIGDPDILNFYLAKCSPLGTWIWRSRIRNSDILLPSDNPHFGRLHIDKSSEAIYFAGQYFENVGFYNNADIPQIILSESSGSRIRDGYLSKCTTDGNWEWVARIAHLYATGIGLNRNNFRLSTDCRGHIYIGCDVRPNNVMTFYNGITPFNNIGNQQFQIKSVSSGIMSDLILAKCDPAGTWEWCALVSGSLTETLSDVLVDNLNRVDTFVSRRSGYEFDSVIYVTGSFNSNPVVFYNGISTGLGPYAVQFGLPILPPNVNHIFMAQCSSSGNWNWGANISGGRAVSSTILDGQHNIYMSGYYTSTSASFHNGISNGMNIAAGEGNIESSFTLNNPTSFAKAFIAKCNASGSWLWGAQISSGDEYANNLLVDSCNNLIVSGNFTNQISFYDGITSGTNLGSLAFKLPYLGPTDTDMYIAKCTSAGSWIWVTSVSGVAGQKIQLPTIDANDNIYLSGVYENTDLIKFHVRMTSPDQQLIAQFAMRVSGTLGSFIAKMPNETTLRTIGILQSHRRDLAVVIFDGEMVVTAPDTDLIIGRDYFLDASTQCLTQNCQCGRFMGTACACHELIFHPDPINTVQCKSVCVGGDSDSEDEIPDRLSKRQIATLQWYQDPGRGGIITSTDKVLRNLAFDGRYIWVCGTNIVYKIDPTTNKVVAEITSITEDLRGIAFDNQFIWVCGGFTLYKINVLTHSVFGIIIDPDLKNIAFDGRYIWITSATLIIRFDPINFSIEGVLPLINNSPYGIAYDGTYIWITTTNGLARIDPSLFPNMVSYTILVSPRPLYDIIFDGYYLWMSTNDNVIWRVDPNKAMLGFSLFESLFMSATALRGLTYDGRNIWAGVQTNKIDQIDANAMELAKPLLLPAMTEPIQVLYDGTNIWAIVHFTGINPQYRVIKFLP